MKPNSSINDFPVVCVGGSAGGLDAYTRLLRHLPADLGAAIIIVNHLRSHYGWSDGVVVEAGLSTDVAESN
jgi:chemotaxis response regulator CheB